MAPWLLFGLLISGLLHSFLPQGWIANIYPIARIQRGSKSSPCGSSLASLLLRRNSSDTLASQRRSLTQLFSLISCGNSRNWCGFDFSHARTNGSCFWDSTTQPSHHICYCYWHFSHALFGKRRNESGYVGAYAFAIIGSFHNIFRKNS